MYQHEPVVLRPQIGIFDGVAGGEVHIVRRDAARVTEGHHVYPEIQAELPRFVTKAFGVPLPFGHVELWIEPGVRLCVTGDGSKYERGAYCKWVRKEQAVWCKDPLMALMIAKKEQSMH